MVRPPAVVPGLQHVVIPPGAQQQDYYQLEHIGAWRKRDSPWLLLEARIMEHNFKQIEKSGKTDLFCGTFATDRFSLPKVLLPGWVPVPLQMGPACGSATRSAQRWMLAVKALRRLQYVIVWAEDIAACLQRTMPLRTHSPRCDQTTHCHFLGSSVFGLWRLDPGDQYHRSEY